MRSLLLVILTVLLGACAATGKPFVKADKPGESYARVYVYRPAYFVQAGIYPTVYLDSKPVGDLKNGGYLTFLSPPGNHELSFSGSFFQWGHPPRMFSISVDAGRNYFYKIDPGMRGEGNRTIHSYSFGRIEEAAAMVELQSLNESL